MKKTSAAILVIFCFLTFLNLEGYAQTKKFKWSYGLCEHVGTYDSTKYTEKQLFDTEKLTYQHPELSLSYDAAPNTLENIDKLDVKNLDAEYRKRLKEWENLDLVEGELWENLRQKYIENLKEDYQRSRVTVLAYKNPAVLREIKTLKICENQYTNPLIAGGDYLLTTWLKLNLDQRAINADPERVKKEYEEKYASPDRLRYARLDVMRFGWWNCSMYTNTDGSYSCETDFKQDYTEEFSKLFKNVESDCDEP